jgi:hypothetical protein
MGIFTFLQRLLQWQSSEFYAICLCVCSLRYPACNAHAPYFHLLFAPLYNNFLHFLINCKIFGGKNVIEYKTSVSSSLQILPATFFILWGAEREMIKNYVGLHVKYPLFLNIISSNECTVY